MIVQVDSARLIGAGTIAPSPTWHVGPASHANHELIIVNRGAIRVDIEGEHLLGWAGDALLYRAGEVHEEWSDPDDPVETFFLSFELADLAAPRVVQDVAGRLRQVGRWLALEWPDHAIGTGRLCDAFFRALLSEWDRLVSVDEPELVAATRRLVRARINGPIDLAMLADARGMSRYHYIRTYKRLCGRTPMADVRAERVRYAQHLIANTDLPLKEVAARAGLSDEYHLSHLIRSYLDVTPGQLRRSRM